MGGREEGVGGRTFVVGRVEEEARDDIPRAYATMIHDIR